MTSKPAHSELSTAEPPNAAETMARALRRAGATHAFGIPGGEVLALLEGFRRAGIRFFLAKHENAAGFMAEGHWHATGTLPVLVSTLGPGVANAVNVVANAMQDRVPLIFLTGCVDAALAESYTHQVFDHQAVLRPIVKASFRVAPGTEALVIRKAIAIAREGRPGPVHIDLPISVAEAPSLAAPLAEEVTPAPAALDPAAIDAALSAARNPLVIAGLDLVVENGAAALRAFVERTGIPVLTTYKGKGLIDEHHPLALGAVGLSPKADALVQPLIAEADLILLAGYDPIEMRQGWRNPWPADKTVIDLAAGAIHHGMHSATMRVVGPVGPALDRLARTGLREPVWPSGAPARLREAMRRAFAPPADWGPHQVFATIRDLAPPERVATADSGSHRILLSQMWTCAHPRSLLQSSGLCTMGCALPLAIGAALGTGQPAICFVGDAGLEMSLGELATLRDLALPVIVVVMVDRQLGLIALKQQMSGLPETGIAFGGTDFPALARAMGGHGEAISSREALAAAFEAALARPGFTLLACEIGPDAYRGAF